MSSFDENGGGGGGGGSKEDHSDQSKKMRLESVQTESVPVPEMHASPERQIILVLKDGNRLAIKEECAVQSELFKQSLGMDTPGADGDDDGSGSEEEEGDSIVEIQVPSISLETMTEIVTYMMHHVSNPVTEIPMPIPSNKLTDFVTDPFDLEFITARPGEDNAAFVKRMGVITECANFIDIKPLLMLTAASLAVRIKGATMRECNVNFGLDPDMEFTAEDEARIRAEHPWIETEL